MKPVTWTPEQLKQIRAAAEADPDSFRAWLDDELSILKGIADEIGRALLEGSDRYTKVKP